MPQRKISRSFSESYPLLSPRSDHLAEHHEHGYRDHAKQGVHQCGCRGGLAVSAVKFGERQRARRGRHRGDDEQRDDHTSVDVDRKRDEHHYPARPPI